MTRTKIDAILNASTVLILALIVIMDDRRITDLSEHQAAQGRRLWELENPPGKPLVTDEIIDYNAAYNDGYAAGRDAALGATKKRSRPITVTTVNLPKDDTAPAEAADGTH